MSGNVFDKLAVSRPVNRQSATVAGSGGSHYSPKIKTCERVYSDIPVHSDVPAKMVQNLPKAPTFTDLTGRKFGKFTVVGYLGKLNPKVKGKWQVRCVCGSYEQRTAKAICSAIAGVPGTESTAMCLSCYQWNAVKNRYASRGAAPVQDFVYNGFGDGDGA